MLSDDGLNLPPIIKATVVCHTERCPQVDLTLDIQMIEGTPVTCAGCEQEVTDVTHGA